MRELTYFSRRRLHAFFPERPPHSWPSTNLELNAQIAKVNIGSQPSVEPEQAELKKFYQVTRHLEREAAYFTSPDLTPGEWIFFDVEMGYGTSHEDCKLPDLDDVVFFTGPTLGRRPPRDPWTYSFAARQSVFSPSLLRQAGWDQAPNGHTI